MQKCLKLFVVVLVILQIWTVSTQLTENNENSLSIILSEIQKIQLNTANIELKLKESDEIIAKQNAEFENNLRLLNTEVDELLKAKKEVADSKDEISKLKSTINDKNDEISKLQSEKQWNDLQIERLNKKTSEIDELNHKINEYKIRMNRVSDIQIDLERYRTESADCRGNTLDLEKTLREAKLDVKHCESWKELFMNKLRSSTTSGSLPTSCLNLTAGIQEIQLPNGKPFYVLCGSDGSMIIQLRIDGRQGFNKDWQQYVDGVGDIHGEFFMGLENLHLITNATRHKLKVNIESDREDVTVEYDDFRIGNSESQYELESIGNFAGDSNLNALHNHVKMPFSINNENWENTKAGWWYTKQTNLCDLNAQYGFIYWKWFNVRRAKMEIRPYTDGN